MTERTIATGGAGGWLDEASSLFAAGLPDHFDRLRWSAERLHTHQTDQLRALLTTAIERSRFHAERLGGTDPTTIELDQLHTLPVMTKTEMMAHFNEVVTDTRINIRSVNAHLGRQGTEPALLLGKYVPLASGGSTGERGVFLYDRHTLVTFLSTVVRAGMASMAAAAGRPPSFPVSMTIVAAPSAVHATGAAPHLARSIADLTFAPATLPFDEIVRRVAGSQPTLLVGYTTMIARLADEQAAGRLAIEPKMVIVTSEQLTPDLARRITAGFGMPPANSFGSSEGLIGTAAPGSEEFTFASDAAVVEFVDAADRPVAPGSPAHHVLVTNLINHTQPLVRYRLDDNMVSLPPSTEHGHQRARLEGRSDEIVRLGGALVHPLTIRSATLAHPTVTEYQAHISDRALTLRIVTAGPTNGDQLRNDLASALHSAGAAGVTVAVNVVDKIERNVETGKAKRFVTS